MAKVSSKRQITLPVDLCEAADIEAGDVVETYVDRQGVISIIKKQSGAASGFLKHVIAKDDVTDEQSLMSAVDQ